MNLNMMKFVSVILLLTFSAHYFLYFSWVRFFDIPSGHYRKSLFAALAFLSITFILASISIHMVNHAITRAYYLFSGLWMGLLTFLLMATLFLWVVKVISIAFPGPVSGPRLFLILSGICYGLAVIYTGICHYQFYRIILRDVHIPVLNLPEQWENKKIIHLSDLHLGGAQDIGFLKKVVSMVNREQADLVVITGDLFDGATRSMERYMPLLETLKASHGVCFTSGNHEMYSGIRKIRQMIEKSTITLLDNKSVVLDGLQVLGLSYPEANLDSSFDFSDPEKFNPDLPTILLYHTPTRINNNDTHPSGVQSADYLAPDTSFSIAIKQGIFLQLSGHTHAGQFFPYTWFAGKIFKGFHYGLHRMDHFYINISAGTGSWGPPMRSGYLSEIGVITLTADR